MNQEFKVNKIDASQMITSNSVTAEGNTTTSQISIPENISPEELVNIAVMIFNSRKKELIKSGSYEKASRLRDEGKAIVQSVADGMGFKIKFE